MRSYADISRYAHIPTYPTPKGHNNIDIYVIIVDSIIWEMLMRVFFGLYLFLSFAVAQSCSGSNCQSCTQQGSGSCEWCLSTSSCLSSSNSNCTSYIQNPSYCPPLQVRERTKRAACFSFFSSSSLTSDFSLQCSSFSDCISCSNSGCGWCLDTNACGELVF